MAHVTLFKYLIISNHYFTKKGFTDKDRVLVIICGNNLIHIWNFLNLIKPALQFSPKNVIFEVEIMNFLMPGQNFGIFASPRKGMDTLLFEMSMKWAFTFKNFRNVYWHGKTHGAMWYPLHILLLLGHQMQLFPMVANHRSNDAMFAMYRSSLLCIHVCLSNMKNVFFWNYEAGFSCSVLEQI